MLGCIIKACIASIETRSLWLSDYQFDALNDHVFSNWRDNDIEFKQSLLSFQRPSSLTFAFEMSTAKFPIVSGLRSSLIAYISSLHVA